MDKRQFLVVTALGSASLPSLAAITNAKTTNAKITKPLSGPALLTLTGAIGAGNRGALDPALDQMMHKQNVHFDKAHTFDFAALAALTAVQINPTLEYDAKVHRLSGPLLIDVVKASGAKIGDAAKFILRAVDGYAVQISAADAKKYRFIVATHLDGQPMPLGGLGPLWAVYDADRFPDMASKPVNQRFALCPWALYHIEVQS